MITIDNIEINTGFYCNLVNVYICCVGVMYSGEKMLV